MNLKNLSGGVLLLTLIAGVTLPQLVGAQSSYTDPNANGGDVLFGGDTNGIIDWAINMATGGTQPGTGSADTDSPQAGTGSTNVGGTFSVDGVTNYLVNTGVQVIGNTLNGVVTFVTNPIGTTVNMVTDAYIAVVNNANGWSNTSVGGTQPGMNPVTIAVTGISNIVENMFTSSTNAGIDAVVEAGNQGGWWSNTSVGGTTYGDPGQAITGTIEAIVNTVVVDPIVGAVNLLTGGVSGENPSTGAQTGGSVYGGGLAPSVIPSGGYVEVTTDPVTGQNYTTVFDENGNAVRSNDPSRHGQGGNGRSGGGPSIPGASRGTVGNPFSDGSDKDDAPSDNDQDNSSPWLLDYDPSSTNNNPAGDGAMEN